MEHSYKYYVLNQPQTNQRIIQLGLDLKGGLNIILELDGYVFLDRFMIRRIIILTLILIALVRKNLRILLSQWRFTMYRFLGKEVTLEA